MLTYEQVIAEVEEAIEAGCSLLMEDLTDEAQATLRAHAAETGTALPIPSREEL